MDHLELAHNLWQNHLNSSDFAIDLTCGNGYDTLFLADLLKDGLVFGIDLQQKAIEATFLKIQEYKNVALFQLAHPNLPLLPIKPKLAVYNLGYLPSGDKSITTTAPTTIASLDTIKDVLSLDGAISITCYPGHAAGLIEEEAVLLWAKNLAFAEWDVVHFRKLNRDRSPSLIWIKKKTSSHRPKNNQSEYLA